MTRSRFVLTPEAREDLLEIWNYIAEDSPENADKVLGKALRCFCAIVEDSGDWTPSR